MKHYMRADYKNQWTEAIFDGQAYHFRSKFERNWAAYLQFLVETGEIERWEYEPVTFYFAGEKTAPVQYTPDFRIWVKGELNFYYQETKGHFDGKTNKKFQRLDKHFPHVIIELVLMSIPKSKKQIGANRRGVARKYTRRIIDASEIFKQIKGLVNIL